MRWRRAREAGAVALVLAVCPACGDDVLPPSGLTDGSSSSTAGSSDSGHPSTTEPSPDDTTQGTGAESSTDPGSTSGTSSDSGSGEGTSSTSSAATGSSSDTGTSSGTDDTGTGTSSSGSETSSGASSTSTDTGTLADTGSASDTGEAMVCIDVELGSALGLTLGDTTDLADDLDPPCVAGLGGPDAGHHFVAPADGFYAFDTAGSAFDTVLHAWAPDCTGTLLGCDDDFALGAVQARLSLYLGAAQEAVVVVDGWDDTQAGAYALDVSAVFEPCVDEDLGQVLSATIMGTTTGEIDKLEPTCLPASGPDYLVRWVAPSNDVYRIRTAGSSFDTVLYVLPGECAGAAIACNDDASPVDLSSVVQVAPGIGQAVTIVVDGFDDDEHGPFTLSVEPL